MRRAHRGVWVESLLAVGILMVALATAPAVGDASSQRTKRVQADFAYVSAGSVYGCTWGIGVEFGEVAGVREYRISYYDGYYKHPVEGTETVAQLSSNPLVGKGTLISGITGGGYSPPCEAGGDASEGGRFTGTPTVLALLPEKSVVVSGRVTKCTPSVSGCTRPEPQGGVEITARRAGVPSVTAITAADGTYQMALAKKGRYLIIPHDPPFSGNSVRRDAITDYLQGPRVVDVRGNRTGVDFSGYNAADHAPPPSLFTNAPPGTLAGIRELKSLDPNKEPDAFLKRGRNAPVRLAVGDLLQKGDVVTTDGNTVLALELVSGGTVGINKSSAIELTGERTASDRNGGGVILSKGELWSRVGELKEPLEVQTNGGVMGIRG